MKNRLLLAIGIIIASRFLSIYLFGAKDISNEWGVMVSIMEEHQMIGFRTVGGEIMPNIFMPPLYPIFLFLVKIFFSNLNYYLLTIQLIQLLFSVISLLYIIKILSKFFSQKITYIGAYIFILFPLNIYIPSQISSISLQILLTMLFIYYFIESLEISSNKNIILFSISSALLILLRGEFYVFYILTLIFISYKKKIKLLILSLLITLLLISPYLIRNYYIFETITVTKSVGFNLYKGNNPISQVEGTPMLNDVKHISEETQKKIDKIKPQEKYDLLIDSLYKEDAKKFIIDNPTRYIKLYFAKLFSFFFVDLNSTYPNYYNIFHLMPKILISISTLWGMFLLINRSNILNFFSLYYVLSALIFSIFFILPRYSLSVLPIQIFLTCYFIDKNKFLRNYL